MPLNENVAFTGVYKDGYEKGFDEGMEQGFIYGVSSTIINIIKSGVSIEETFKKSKASDEIKEIVLKELKNNQNK